MLYAYVSTPREIIPKLGRRLESPENAHVASRIDEIRMSVRVGVPRYFSCAAKSGNHWPSPTPMKPNWLESSLRVDRFKVPK